VSVPAIEISDLVKIYGTVKAISGLNLKVMPGEIYGLLGPNGAGKSTTIKIVCGLVEPTSGSVKVWGVNPTNNPIEVKSKIGYVSENLMLYESLSPRDFFEFVTAIRKMNRSLANQKVAQLVEAFGIAQYYDSPIASLSMGTKQKVAVIASLIHQPQLLLLDEPLNSLDAKSGRILKDLISFHTENGGSVLFSTHIMEVAEQLCTRIGIIYQGKILIEGTVDELRDRVGGKDSTLEEVFLKLTNEETEVADTVRMLREAFYKNEAK